jgi:hypothetical protein
MQQFYRYHHEYVHYRISLEKASGKIINMLDSDLKRKYSDDKWDYDPQGLWNEIKKERERVLKIDGKQLLFKISSLKMADFKGCNAYYTELKNLRNQLEVCDIRMENSIIAFHLLNGLPNTPEWRQFSSTLSLMDKDTDPDEIMVRLEVFETDLRRLHAIPHDVALFAKGGTKYNNGRQTGHQARHAPEASGTGKQSKKTISCYGCGRPGHKKNECRSRDKWDDRHDKRKQKDGANVIQHVEEEEDIILLAAGSTLRPEMPTGVNGGKESAAKDVQPKTDEVKALIPTVAIGANYWIVDSGATNHVTGDR